MHIFTRNTPWLRLFQGKHNMSLLCRDFPWCASVPPHQTSWGGRQRMTQDLRAELDTPFTAFCRLHAQGRAVLPYLPIDVRGTAINLYFSQYRHNVGTSLFNICMNILAFGDATPNTSKESCSFKRIQGVLKRVPICLMGTGVS